MAENPWRRKGRKQIKEAQAVSARVCRFSGVVGFYNWKLKWHVGHRDKREASEGVKRHLSNSNCEVAATTRVRAT